MNAITSYLNFQIDVAFYINRSTGYKKIGKVCLFQKSILA